MVFNEIINREIQRKSNKRAFFPRKKVYSKIPIIHIYLNELYYTIPYLNVWREIVTQIFFIEVKLQS